MASENLSLPELSSDLHSVEMPSWVATPVVVSDPDFLYNVADVLELRKYITSSTALQEPHQAKRQIHSPPQWTCPQLPSQRTDVSLFCWHIGVSAECMPPFVHTRLWTHQHLFQHQTHHWYKSLSHMAQLKNKRKKRENFDFLSVSVHFNKLSINHFRLDFLLCLFKQYMCVLHSHGM